MELAGGELLGVRRAAVLEAAPPEDGEPAGPGVFARDGHLLLACTPGLLELLEVQPAGARPMEAGAYLRGHAAPGRR